MPAIIKEVIKNSIAEDLELKSGEEILSINNASLRLCRNVYDL